VVLVTTLNPDGTSNIAPKSWLAMMAFDPPILALGCNLQHHTAQNILRERQFVVNVPGAELAEKVWRCQDLVHPRPVEAAGFTPLPAKAVAPPRVEECKAHLECELDRHLAYGQELILLGKIVAVSLDAEVCRAADPYAALQTFFYLEDGLYGVLEGARFLEKA
jgi:flavin reductase (DIM6/NTAB) family NADH-FMN oxidoreductase RutF